AHWHLRISHHPLHLGHHGIRRAWIANWHHRRRTAILWIHRRTTSLYRHGHGQYFHFRDVLFYFHFFLLLHLCLHLIHIHHIVVAYINCRERLRHDRLVDFLRHFFFYDFFFHFLVNFWGMMMVLFWHFFMTSVRHMGLLFFY